jgi:hypothetical protein
VTASVLGGIALGWLIETPVQRIRERLFPARAIALTSNDGAEPQNPRVAAVGVSDFS